MWNIATTTRTRPSEIAGVKESWAAYQFDSAITSFGLVVENALQEQENIGTKEKPEYVRKYTLKQLLDPEFRIGGDGWKADVDNDPELRGVNEGLIYEMVEN